MAVPDEKGASFTWIDVGEWVDPQGIRHTIDIVGTFEGGFGEVVMDRSVEEDGDIFELASCSPKDFSSCTSEKGADATAPYEFKLRLEFHFDDGGKPSSVVPDSFRGIVGWTVFWSNSAEDVDGLRLSDGFDAAYVSQGLELTDDGFFRRTGEGGRMESTFSGSEILVSSITNKLNSATWLETPNYTPLTYDAILSRTDTAGSPIGDPVTVATGKKGARWDVSAAAAQAPDGYRLVGVDGAQSGTFADRDVHVTARYERIPDAHSVSFDANGGMGAPGAISGEDGSTVTIPDTVPTRDGYSFDGWATDDGTILQPGGRVTLDGNLTLTAQWKVVSHTVTFDPAGGQDGPDAQTADHGATITLPKAPTRDGYSFDGWRTPDGSVLQVGAKYAVSADTLLTAVWTAKKAVVTFDPGRGSGGPSPIESTTDATETIPADEPTRDGYVFDGWESPDGTVRHGGDTLSTLKDVTLAARWSALDQTVSFVSSRGDAPDPIEAPTGGKVTLPDMTDACARLAAWKAADGTEYRPGDSLTVPAGGLELTAEWDETGCMAGTLPSTGATALPWLAAMLLPLMLLPAALHLRRRSRG